MTRKETIITLNNEYNRICNAYVDEFVKKQGYEFDYWVSSEVGGIASFIEQYYFNMEDIAYDMNNNKPKGKIFSWQDYNIKNDTQWTYSQYCKGLRKRHKQIEDKENPCQVTLTHNGVVVSR
jgi:hypothetical protein